MHRFEILKSKFKLSQSSSVEWIGVTRINIQILILVKNA